MNDATATPERARKIPACHRNRPPRDIFDATSEQIALDGVEAMLTMQDARRRIIENAMGQGIDRPQKP